MDSIRNVNLIVSCNKCPETNFKYELYEYLPYRPATNDLHISVQTFRNEQHNKANKPIMVNKQDF